MDVVRKWMPISLLVFAVASAFCYWWLLIWIDSDFAEEALLNYSCDDGDVSAIVRDESDVLALKQVLRGNAFLSGPSCGFSTDLSVMMLNRRKRIVFCIACDGCPVVRVGEFGRHFVISSDDRALLDNVFEKYGVRARCI